MQTAELRIEYVPLVELQRWPGNPKRHAAGIAVSIDRWGFNDPPAVDETTGRLVEGHGRLEALEARKASGAAPPDRIRVREDGAWPVPVLRGIAFASEQEAEAYVVAHNQLGIAGGWDEVALAQAVTRAAQVKIPGSALGFGAREMRRMLEATRPPATVLEGEPTTPEEQAAKLQRKWKTADGQLWLIPSRTVPGGEHRLVCGSCKRPEDVAKASPAHQLVVTSPPYNCEIEYDQHEDHRARESYLRLIFESITLAVRNLDEGCFVAWNVGVTPKSFHFEHAHLLAAAGLRFYRQIVWEKVGVAYPIWQYTEESGCARKYHPNYCHEVIYLFSRGAPVPGGRCDVDAAFSKDVWRFGQFAATRDLPGVTSGKDAPVATHGGHKLAAHPAAFPTTLPAGCIKHLTARGERVFDPFCGSATTIVAAEQLGRLGSGTEASPGYVAVALERLAALGLEPKRHGARR